MAYILRVKSNSSELPKQHFADNAMYSNHKKLRDALDDLSNRCLMIHDHSLARTVANEYVNWKATETMFLESIDLYAKNWSKREQVELKYLSEWKTS